MFEEAFVYEAIRTPRGKRNGALTEVKPLNLVTGLIEKMRPRFTMTDELERRDVRRALMTLCVGGGMDVATVIERV